MKKVITTLVCGALINLSVNAAPAADRATVQIDGSKAKITLAQPKGNEKMGIFQWHWNKSLKEFSMLANSKAALTTEWQVFSFSFTPQGSGAIALQLKGSSKEKNIDFDSISVEGAEIANGDIEVTWKNKAKNWWSSDPSSIVQKAADAKGGSNYISIAHKKMAKTDLVVSAGQQVTVNLWARINPGSSK